MERAEQVKTFKEIKGVRFRDDLPEDTVTKISEFFDAEERSFQEREIKDKSKDPYSYIEHRLMGGSAPTLRKPLTPYNILTGKVSAEEAVVAREKRIERGPRFIYPVERLINPQNGETAIEFDISSQDREEFIKFLKDNNLADKKYIMCNFEIMTMNTGTETLVLPKLKSIGNEYLELPENLQGKIGLKEFYDTSLSQRLRLNTPMTVDQHGWRIEGKSE